MLGGSFENALGQEVTYDILELHDYEGRVWDGGDMESHLHESDRVFYEIEVGGETYYRWVAGPFESEGDLESAIADEADFYTEAA
jgi:hypothetical protein